MLIDSRNDITGVNQFSPQRHAKTSLSWIAILIIFSLVTALVAGYQITEPLVLDRSWAAYIAYIGIGWLLIYFLCSYRTCGHPYLFTSAYVIVLSVFHLGLVIPDALGIIDASSWSLGLLGPWLERAGWYTLLSLGCIGLGFALAISKTIKHPEISQQDGTQYARETFNRLFVDGVGLLIASGILFIYAWHSYGNLLKYSRADFFHGVGGADPRGLGVFLMFFPSAVALLVIGARSNKEKTFATLVGLLGFCFLLLSGYRSAALFPFLSSVIVWVKTGRKVPFALAVTAVVIVLILIPAVGHLRTITTYGNIDNQAVKDSLKEASIDKAFAEMGGTAGVLAHVLRLVPREDGYRWGTSYLYAIKESVPNVTSRPGQSARGTKSILRKAENDPIERLKPSQWITYRVAPEKFQVGEGIGFSGIAEPYINFGLSGVVVFFLGLGFLLGRMDTVGLIRHPWLLTFATCMFWMLLRTVRNDAVNFTKPAIFTLLTILLWRLCTIPFYRRSA